MKREYEIAIRWRAFPLHPDTPEEGLLLEQLFADYPIDVKKMMSKLHKTANDLGLPFGERERTYNSRKSQELGLWAESKNKGDKFHKAVFRAYFADGKNIAKVPVVQDFQALKISCERPKPITPAKPFNQMLCSPCFVYG